MLAGRRRILVIGAGGAGKSTFARALAARTGLPVVHLDRHYWQAGWRPTPDEDWIPQVERLCAEDSWIMDGNFGGTLELRLRRADAVVFFDLPRAACLAGVLRRWMGSYGRARPELPPGCPEKLDLAFLAWIWNYPVTSRPRILEAVSRLPRSVPVVRVESRAEARRLLDTARR